MTGLNFDFGSLTAYTGLQGLFYILFIIFVIYGLFLGYHWFSYGTSKNTSTIALAVYLCGGAVLFLILAGAIRSLA